MLNANKQHDLTVNRHKTRQEGKSKLLHYMPLTFHSPKNYL